MTARILVVDDIEANVRLLEAKLSAEYYEVISASDGPTALALAAAEHPDIVLLDVMMPGMDGLEATRRIRTDARFGSLPIIAIAAAWIKLSSPGPIFYRQMREGLDGRRIAVWKLRTMYMNGEHLLEEWFEDHPEDQLNWRRYFKLRHDPRVLPLIGRLLRRTSLDELPQLWSVLSGKMSLVGPRPLPDYHLDQFPSEFRRLRTRVLPGLTGLWQVSTRSDGDVKVQEALDTFYIRNWSPWLDLYILARTVTAVLLARGAY